MKSYTLAFLILSASAAIVKPRNAQAPAANGPKNPLAIIGAIEGLLAMLPSPELVAVALPKAKLSKTDLLTPELRPNAKRAVFRYGPYTLVGKGQPRPAMTALSLDPTGQSFADILTPGLCTNCTVLRGKTGLAFEDDSPAGTAQGIYVHHILSFDLSKEAQLPISACGVGQTGTSIQSRLGSEFLAQGDDASDSDTYFTSRDGKYPSGFHVGPNHKWLNQLDVVNYNPTPKTVYLTYDLEYEDGLVGSDAASTLVSVTGCQSVQNPNGAAKGKGINLDKNGIAITNSPKFVISRDSKIVSAFGHMHNGGSKMVLQVNGKDVCTSNATYGKPAGSETVSLTSMTPCGDPIVLKKDDVVTMQSIYDLASHPIRRGSEKNSIGMPDVMGMFYLSFAIDK